MVSTYVGIHILCNMVTNGNNIIIIIIITIHQPGLPLFPGESDIDQLFHIIRCFGKLTDQQLEFFHQNPLFVGVKIPEVANRELETLEKRFKNVSSSQLEAMSLCLDYDPDRRATCTELMRCEMS